MVVVTVLLLLAGSVTLARWILSMVRYPLSKQGAMRLSDRMDVEAQHGAGTVFAESEWNFL